MSIMKKLILLVYLFRVCLCGVPVAPLDRTKPLVEVKEEPAIPHEWNNELLNATLFRTVKSYYCRAEIDGDEELLLFGTKAWMFPSQDVNLTLRYPSENQQFADEDKSHVVYMLTGLKVVLHLSGPDSKGFITSGGMYQDHISMTFVFRNLTSLSYQFYLYGTPRKMLNVTENYNVELDLC